MIEFKCISCRVCMYGCVVRNLYVGRISIDSHEYIKNIKYCATVVTC